MDKVAQVRSMGEQVSNQIILGRLVPGPSESGQGLDVDFGKVKGVVDPFEIDTPSKAGIGERRSGRIHASLEQRPEQKHRPGLVHDPALGLELVCKEIGPWVAVELLKCGCCPGPCGESAVEQVFGFL